MVCGVVQDVAVTYIGHMPEDTQRDPLLTVPEAATYLSMSQRSVYNRIYDGALTRVRLGSSVRIRLSELNALIAASTEGGK